MKPINIITVLLGTLLFLSSCSGGSFDVAPEPTQDLTPEKATLIFPLKDEICNEGDIISDTESKVTFEWNKTENTDSYTLVVTNLNDQSKKNVKTESTSAPLTINRGTPYQWMVVSTSSTGSTESDSWNFFNAGPGDENHVPFPASLISPENDQTIAGTTVELKWAASDIDNDIKTYRIYLDEQSDPDTLIGETAENLLNTTVSVGKTYYWKVETVDQNGAASISKVKSFTVQ